MLRIIGIVLLVIGIAGLAVGTVQHTRTKRMLKVGSIGVQAKERERFTIPPLAAGRVVAVGLGLVVAGRKK